MTLPGQMELNTVISHEAPKPNQETHKPAGIRLATMLYKYEYAPSSELWRKIQELAREIMKS